MKEWKKDVLEIIYQFVFSTLLFWAVILKVKFQYFIALVGVEIFLTRVLITTIKN